MCGIAAIAAAGSSRVRAREIFAMTEAIAHRGPDDAGHVLIDLESPQGSLEVDSGHEVHGEWSVALGHRRLSILDLSMLGHQPMSFAGCSLVYNGEIYNYLELAAELRRAGHTFVSRSDTEVLLHAYVEWGHACLERLNGIFAFALWDGRRRELFCARDRLGVKPLYYTRQGDRLLVCSEIKGLLTVLPRAPQVNEGVVYDFLASHRIEHTSETFFAGIERLPAGQQMVFSDGALTLATYWDPGRVVASSASLDEHVAAFGDLFADAIRLQMRSDVPVGCCLSGGLDSSAVASVASRLSSHSMKVFTARFSDPRMDEWRYAQHVHRAHPIEPFSVLAGSDEFWRHLPAVVRAQEEPFSGPGVFVQWRLMRLIAERGIRVVLDGQGGDELLCGYAKYFYLRLRELWREHRPVGIAVAVADAILRGGAQLFSLADARRYLPGLHPRRSRLLQPGFCAAHAGRAALSTGDELRSQQLLDLQQSSLPALLRYEDKNSMAHSIESRVPFLDHRLVELALAMPSAHKIHRSESKRVLRLALRGVVPDAILDRRSKLGFGGYYESWIRALEPPIEAWIREKVRPVERYVTRKALTEMLRSHDVNLFRSLVLDHWLIEFGMT